MGRSVAYPMDCAERAFFRWPTFCDVDDDGKEIEGSDQYEDADDVLGAIGECFGHLPSICGHDPVRIQRECPASWSNALVWFGVSEYCGFACFWAVPRNAETADLAVHWIRQVWPKIMERFPYDRFERDGFMSNGEGVYRRVS